MEVRWIACSCEWLFVSLCQPCVTDCPLCVLVQMTEPREPEREQVGMESEWMDSHAVGKVVNNTPNKPTSTMHSCDFWGSLVAKHHLSGGPPLAKTKVKDCLQIVFYKWGGNNTLCLLCLGGGSFCPRWQTAHVTQSSGTAGLSHCLVRTNTRARTPSAHTQSYTAREKPRQNVPC